MNFLDRRKIEEALRAQLLFRLQERQPELNALLDEMEGHGGIENMIYKFYQHSFKVYRVQALTEVAVGLLQSLMPDRDLWTPSSGRSSVRARARNLSWRTIRIGCAIPVRWWRPFFKRITL